MSVRISNNTAGIKVNNVKSETVNSNVSKSQTQHKSWEFFKNIQGIVTDFLNKQINIPSTAFTPNFVLPTKNAIENGATEVDMVIPVGVLKDKDYIAVENDIRAVVEAAKSKALTKVIIETCLLTDEEKIMACKLSKSAGADFVKTSTGFSTAGATVKDIRLMRETVGEQMGVKASGGVRSREDADAMIKAGATRIGTSNGVKIVEG